MSLSQPHVANVDASHSVRASGRAMGLGLCVLLAMVTILCYANSFNVPFLFDDVPRISENQAIQTLWPISVPTANTNRPLGMFSFAMNYAIHGDRVWGYHVTNLVIHIFAGLTLFGIVRRTLSLPSLPNRFRDNATFLAFAVALVWLVHPLNTQAVTYTIQRLESLMGLCYLATLYCFIRAQGSVRPNVWLVTSIAFCTLGMGTKEVMVTAPLVVLIYHRVFIAKSWREVSETALPYYVGLFSTWAVLAWCMLRTQSEYASGNLLFVENVTPWDYLLTQAGVITHYLRLSFWPEAQSLDYGWPVAHAATEVALPLLVVGILLSIALWAVIRCPKWGFLGLCFFVILAPSSSFVPIIDVAFEQRMYLPLAALVTLVIFTAFELTQKVVGFVQHRSDDRGAVRGTAIGLLALLPIAAVLGMLTHRRNGVYASEETIWQDVVAKRPNNPRGRNNYGFALQKQGKTVSAIAQLDEALRLKPEYPEAHNNLGNALQDQGKLEDAIPHYREAIRLKPDYVEAANNLANALLKQGKPELAVEQYEQVIRLDPGFPEAHNNLGNALQAQGKFDQAIEQYREAIRLQPDFPGAQNNLGIAYQRQGKFDLAAAEFQKAIESRPDDPEAYNNLGNVLQEQGQFEAAMKQYREAIRVSPEYVEAYNNLGNALQRTGQPDLAVQQYDKVLQLKPDYAQVYYNRSAAYFQLGQFDQAWADIKSCRKLGIAPPQGYIDALTGASGRSE